MEIVVSLVAMITWDGYLTKSNLTACFTLKNRYNGMPSCEFCNYHGNKRCSCNGTFLDSVFWVTILPSKECCINAFNITLSLFKLNKLKKKLFHGELFSSLLWKPFCYKLQDG